MENPTEQEEGYELGRGRSGVVYRCRDDHGRDIARKVFSGDTASTLVHYVFTGAPNPYVWSRDAVETAFHRRGILATLTEYWFGSALCVAQAWAVGWNESTRSHRLDTQFVDGRPATLHHPFSGPREGEFSELTGAIMRPLQRHLVEAGLDGSVWQAGLSNPVALNNFLKLEGPDGEHRWAWIDLESGVPALIPINPFRLLSFYLPRSFHHRRPLFDDVDVPKLRAYIEAHAEKIEELVGSGTLHVLAERIDRLERHQDAWRALSRVQRGIEYQLVKGGVTQEQATWYRTHPVSWYARELRRGIREVIRRVQRLLASVWLWLKRVDAVALLHSVARFARSQTYRAEISHAYVATRLDRWTERNRLDTEDSAYLHDALRREGVSSYITDFGVHIAIKPAVKLVQWIVLPALLAAGVIGPVTLGALIVFGGMMARTVYTLGRMIQSALVGHQMPWIALLVGLIPVAGNAAYAVQIIASGATRRGRLAAFILYDTLSTAGEMLPIWGGRDTVSEHRFNHLADLVVRDRNPLPHPAEQ